MSFPVAVQSAVFYLVACTPCAKVRHRQKAKGQAKKERQEKAKLETEQPGLYRHPSPFNTNPYWQDEISMGPSLPKKAVSKNSSQRGLTSSGRESSSIPSMSEHTAMGDSRTNFGDSPSTMPEDDAVSDDWNTRRGYQREDEELWGQFGASGTRLMDAFSKARDSAGRLIDATLGIDKEVTDQERHDFYFSPRNPPVNDYHPPVVSSKPPHRDARKWMLQPPPPAKIMEGKVPVSRAVSSGSKSSGRTMGSDETQAGRALQDKLAQERSRKESNPTERELIESLFRPRSRRSTNYARSRSLSLNESDDSQENPFDRRKKSRRRPRPAHHGLDSDDEEGATQPHITDVASRSTSGSTRAARRPKLETIPSMDAGEGGQTMSRKSTKRQKSRRNRTTTWANSPVGDDTE
ncbi:signal peptide-containing protein [Hirsutella rhossiliensis]|uniref:Signal peptide-containing protein n=1 Tax=Hirsutella rhossiliensis TaxID=111463 RepID=A0A9P8SI18_9HYPO|nr:signal peptide-containing protein [Hirsutella rhossiliensis]KAH0963406.1 signal peptide-containing protein [Hirsutella rhossiliensis]